MNTSYYRVLPRDAFNEATLLKCVGKLTLLIDDRKIEGMIYHHDGQAFSIAQDESDGSIHVTNISFWLNKKQVTVCTPMNSRLHWPLILRTEDNDEFMFSETGEFVL